MMFYSLTPDRRGRILGIVALVAAAPLALSYFTYGKSLSDTRELASMFYRRLHPGWALLREGEIESAFTGNPDLWTTLAVRAAYGRWRLRGVAPEAFDNLMKDYGRGWWIAPGRAAWVRIFETHDAQWLAARAGAKSKTAEKSASIETTSERVGENDCVVRFPTEPETPEVGSLVGFVFEAAPEDVVTTAPVRVFWETRRAPGVVAHRRRLGSVTSLDGAPPGRLRFRVDVDLSWESAWMDSGSAVRGFDFRGNGLGRWNLVRIEFGDSPLLKATENPSQAASRPAPDPAILPPIETPRYSPGESSGPS